MRKFISALIELSGVSRAYAMAKWYGLTDYDRTKPILAAVAVAKKLKTQSNYQKGLTKDKKH